MTNTVDSKVVFIVVQQYRSLGKEENVTFVSLGGHKGNGLQQTGWVSRIVRLTFPDVSSMDVQTWLLGY